MKVQTSVGTIEVRWRKLWRGLSKRPHRDVTQCEVILPNGWMYVGDARRHPQDRHNAGVAQYWSLRRAVEKMVERIRYLGWEPRRDVFGMAACIEQAFWRYACENWGAQFLEVHHMKTFVEVFEELWPRENGVALKVVGNTALRDDQRRLLELWEELRKYESSKTSIGVDLFSDGSGSVRYYACLERPSISWDTLDSAVETVREFVRRNRGRV